jgi:hypothetical protein
LRACGQHRVRRRRRLRHGDDGSIEFGDNGDSELGNGSEFDNGNSEFGDNGDSELGNGNSGDCELGNGNSEFDDNGDSELGNGSGNSRLPTIGDRDRRGSVAAPTTWSV